MKLAVLIAALCTASCTAITLAAERPKPQLQRANKVLALRGGGLVQATQKLCKSTFSPIDPRLFGDCIKAFFLPSDGLLAVFLWSALYLIGALGWLNLLPFGWGGTVQKVFQNIYRKQGELGYIRFEILFILSAVANTAVLLFTHDRSVQVKLCALVWATTFTLVVIKFASEEHIGWIDDNKNYYAIQILHTIFALACGYGAIYGTAA